MITEAERGYVYRRLGEEFERRTGFPMTFGQFMAEADPPIELPDADINPDEAEPLPPDEPVKTDPIPEETE